MLKDVENDLVLFPAFIKLFLAISGELSEAMKVIAKNYGITRQDLRILWNLEPDKSISQVDLSTRVTLPKSSITESIKKLHSLELVNKESNPEDERVSLISLTAKGHQTRHDMIYDWLKQKFFTSYQSLSLEDKRECITVCAKMTEQLLGEEFTKWALSSSGIQQYLREED